MISSRLILSSCVREDRGEALDGLQKPTSLHLGKRVGSSDSIQPCYIGVRHNSGESRRYISRKEIQGALSQNCRNCSLLPRGFSAAIQNACMSYMLLCRLPVVKSTDICNIGHSTGLSFLQLSRVLLKASQPVSSTFGHMLSCQRGARSCRIIRCLYLHQEKCL